MKTLIAFVLVASCSAVAVADWNFSMKTKDRETLGVRPAGDNISLDASFYIISLTKDEAESLANALLWAAGKRNPSPCDILEENRFIEAGKRTVESMQRK